MIYVGGDNYWNIFGLQQANPISDKFFSYSCYGSYGYITASAATATAAAVTSKGCWLLSCSFSPRGNLRAIKESSKGIRKNLCNYF